VAAAALLTVFVGLLAAVSVGHGPVVALDLGVHRLLAGGLGARSRVVLELLVGLGLRGAVSGPALLYATWLSYRARSWRPLLVMVAALLALNVTVGTVKALTGRLAPHAGAPTMFADGTEFPAGHASNSVLTWGTVLWLQQRYDQARVRYWVGRTCVMAVGATVGVGCLFLDTHWVSDIVAGWAAGALLLLALPLTDRVSLTVPTAHRLAARAPVVRVAEAVPLVAEKPAQVLRAGPEMRGRRLVHEQR
jgi:membrane-associated phospholipid phosphatase